MITRYFGLPGCGKTTVAAMEVYKALRSGRYKNVYGNVTINYPGYTYIPFTYVGKYQLEDCMIIVDEAAIECGNRDYKSFAKERVEFFMTHRHYNARVVLFSQQPDGIDVKIRDLTDAMFYIKKGLLTGPWFSSVYRIPYDLVWPDENSNGENLGKIVMGYLKPSFFARLFARRIYRPKYYPYFDSWEVKQLPPLPTEETAQKGEFVPHTIPGDPRADLWLVDYFHKRAILLRCLQGWPGFNMVSQSVLDFKVWGLFSLVLLRWGVRIAQRKPAVKCAYPLGDPYFFLPMKKTPVLPAFSYFRMQSFSATIWTTPGTTSARR